MNMSTKSLPKSCFQGQGSIDAFFITYLACLAGKEISEELRERKASAASYLFSDGDVSKYYSVDEVMQDLQKLSVKCGTILIMEDPFTLDRF